MPPPPFPNSEVLFTAHTYILYSTYKYEILRQIIYSRVRSGVGRKKNTKMDNHRSTVYYHQHRLGFGVFFVFFIKPLQRLQWTQTLPKKSSHVFKV